MTPDEQVVLVVLAAGPTTRDRVASYLQLPEHQAGRVINSLIRKSLVGKVPGGRSRPEYGLTARGLAEARQLTAGLLPNQMLSDQVASFRRIAVAPPPRPARKPRKAGGVSSSQVPPSPEEGTADDAVRRSALNALMPGPLTRDQVASKLGLSEHAAGRLLDRLIWESLAVKLPQDVGRPKYGLTAAGRKKLVGVSEVLQELARNPTAIEVVVPPPDEEPPAMEPQEDVPWIQLTPAGWILLVVLLVILIRSVLNHIA
ncbi:hypothetical protein [Kribbella sp. NPDC051620]|uniref:hypothetical protein n=1 Tax=Kribbella sp. NPDC051620 TaxID=3364120 RepID=UPI0037BC2F81